MLMGWRRLARRRYGTHVEHGLSSGRDRRYRRVHMKMSGWAEGFDMAPPALRNDQRDHYARRRNDRDVCASNRLPGATRFQTVDLQIGQAGVRTTQRGSTPQAPVDRVTPMGTAVVVRPQGGHCIRSYGSAQQLDAVAAHRGPTGAQYRHSAACARRPSRILNARWVRWTGHVAPRHGRPHPDNAGPGIAPMLRPLRRVRPFPSEIQT
ncbi:hypothetical protein GCM10007067_06470 [Lysobacter bugurensis]|uniref:Uncharacterized protein n=1 Tax=Cognatilysobacter bugurensis TaxID=543356 RepID=A0A918SXY1_9GAMM|nr:hypothetical protein GCM10007067_06470 [Lysobacter bugurensis]